MSPASRDAPIGRYAVSLSEASDDPAWDEFVERCPGGHFAQTSAWGRVRASIGWEPVRVVIAEKGVPVAGAQLTVKPAPFGGNVGVVFNGPVIPADRPELAQAVFDELQAVGRARRLQYLLVQPPRGSAWMHETMANRGMRPAPDEITYTSTILIDLAQELDELMSQMKKKTRQNIRNAEKRGVVVRRGTRADLGVFDVLEDEHSARLGYPRRSPDYYALLWDAFAPKGHIELLIAEFEDEPVTALLMVPFGDTVVHLERAWSGEHAELRANELLMWEAIQWAKAQGYRYADTGGIRRRVAHSLLAGEGVPDDVRNSAQAFKAKFGGVAVLDPVPYDWVYNPVLRACYRLVPRGLAGSERARRTVERLRRSAGGGRDR